MRALLDTSVLFPLVLRDLLLDTALVGLFDPLWSADILAELRRNLIEDRGLLAAAVIDLTQAMDQRFPDASVTGYEARIPQMLNHPKDRHVLAAGVEGGADALITSNLRDFPDHVLRPHKIEALSPDEFLCRFFESARDDVIHVLTNLAERYRRPPMSVAELLKRLENDIPEFVNRSAVHLVMDVV